MILSDKGPFLLTVLFACFAWTISQISTDLTNSAVLEINKKTEKTNNRIIYTISNLSRDKLFKELRFTIRVDEKSDGIVTNAIGPIIPPPYDSLDVEEEKRIEATYTPNKAEFSAVKLQTGALVQIIIELSKPSETHLYVRSEDPMRLLDSSLETILIKNRFNLLLALFAVWILILIAYMWLYSRASNSKGGQ